MQSRHDSDRRGIALVIALFALVVIGALVAAVFFTAQLEVRSGANVMSGLQADQAAQAGLEYAAANWNRGWALQGVGQTAVVNWTQLGGTSGYFSDSVTKLNNQMVMVRGFGQVRNGGGTVLASRVGGQLFRFGSVDVGLRAAFTGGGPALIGGSETVSGLDIVPSGGGWATHCASMTTQNRPALRSAAGLYGTGSGYTIYGSVSSYDATAATTVTKLNPIIASLASMPDINLSSPPASVQPALTAGHTCDNTRSDNWGDPTYAAAGVWSGTHPCAAYFPVIYYGGGGTLVLPSGYGQGVLIVNGSLTFGAGFKFYGIIVATGLIQSTGSSSGNIYGAVISQSGYSQLTGNERLDYSSCAMTLAEQSVMLGAPLTQRSYIRY